VALVAVHLGTCAPPVGEDDYDYDYTQEHSSFEDDLKENLGSSKMSMDDERRNIFTETTIRSNIIISFR